MRWCNTYLAKVEGATPMTELDKDLADGVTLLHLVEVIICIIFIVCYYAHLSS
jgi:hypothetical protein